jgi:uncharacterized protein (DUF4415 family)
MKKKSRSKSKEFNFKGARKGARLDSKSTKVMISVRLDPDVVAWLREEAERTAIPYQTLINSYLKQFMTGQEQILRDQIRKVLKEEKEAS